MKRAIGLLLCILSDAAAFGQSAPVVTLSTEPTLSGACGSTFPSVVYKPSTGQLVKCVGGFWTLQSTAPILPVDVVSGGTGKTTLTNHGVVIGAGTLGVSVTSPGTSGQCFVSGGAAADPSFTSCPAGTPGGANTQVQFNDSGAFGGDADLTWNKTTNVLTMVNGANILIGSDSVVTGQGSHTPTTVMAWNGSTQGTTNTNLSVDSTGNAQLLNDLFFYYGASNGTAVGSRTAGLRWNNTSGIWQWQVGTTDFLRATGTNVTLQNAVNLQLTSSTANTTSFSGSAVRHNQTTNVSDLDGTIAAATMLVSGGSRFIGNFIQSAGVAATISCAGPVTGTMQVNTTGSATGQQGALEFCDAASNPRKIFPTSSQTSTTTSASSFTLTVDNVDTVTLSSSVVNGVVTTINTSNAGTTGKVLKILCSTSSAQYPFGICDSATSGSGVCDTESSTNVFLAGQFTCTSATSREALWLVSDGVAWREMGRGLNGT